jgi:hypothetical protein
MEASTVDASDHTSSYRLKFSREKFLELVSVANPKIIYRRKNTYIFAFNSFVMYCDECQENDFSARIIDAIEFSNWSWAK